MTELLSAVNCVHRQHRTVECSYVMLKCCIQYSMTVHNKEKIMSYKKTINCVDKWNNGVILVIEQIKQGTIKNNKIGRAHV